MEEIGRVEKPQSRGQSNEAIAIYTSRFIPINLQHLGDIHSISHLLVWKPEDPRSLLSLRTLDASVPIISENVIIPRCASTIWHGTLVHYVRSRARTSSISWIHLSVYHIEEVL